MSPPTPLGQFLELAIPTSDIAASVQFYERLGFSQRLTGDAWPHPYGVLGDGRIHLGLHQREARGAGSPGLYAPAAQLESPTPCFVRPGLSAHAPRLQQAGLGLLEARLGEESLHHLWLRDPGGHALLVQEVRTFSPTAVAGGAPGAPGAPGAAAAGSLCGEFLQLSLPEPDFETALLFWEQVGFIGMPEEALPYAHQPLTGDQLALAFHAPRTCDAPLLVFESADTAATLERLRKLEIRPLPRPPRALQMAGSLLLQAPEGTLLLIVPALPPA